MSRLIPLIIFMGLAVLLAFGLRDADTKSDIPSPLVGRAAPAFALPTLFNPDIVITRDDLLGEPYLVNFWASWCVTCVEEHPVITELSESGRIKVVGFNFRDEPADAKTWLNQHGDPYQLHLTDYDGRTSIDFGVYAAPETFLVDAQGRIIFKQLGAVTRDVVDEKIFPLLDQMQPEQAP